MANLAKVKKYFEAEIEKLEGVIAKEKLARDSAPSAMESHSDTTKSQKEDLVFALESKLKQLENLIKLVPNNSNESSKVGVWSIVYIDKVKSKVLIVPEGLGGVRVDELLLLSVNSDFYKSLGNKL